MSVMSWRRSPLAARHRALGSDLEDWNGMETAWMYSTSTLPDQHEAIRTRAGLMDVSGLKKVHIVGEHSHHILQLTTTRDVRKIYPGKSVYASMLTDAGKFADDCIILPHWSERIHVRSRFWHRLRRDQPRRAG